jgi:hypothetical protein
MTSLAARFEKVAAMPYLPLEKMEMGLLYTIVHAERVNSIYGPTVQFLVEDRGEQYFIQLPQRCARVVWDDDIKKINSGLVWWTIVCKGYCDVRKLPLLEIIC